MRKFALIIALVCLFGGIAQAQVPVALAPSVHPQFLDSTGKVLSGGFIYTYAAGTTTLQATYTDQSGSIQNANPIPLDATGSPSNGSTQTGIWLSNSSYRFCAYSSALVQQWCVDNVSAYQILNNIQNIILGSVTSDPTGFAGELGYRSDIPCFRGYTAFWDCFVSLTGIQTVTNKTIDISGNTIKNSSNTAGHYPRNNGTQYVDSAIQTGDVTTSLANAAVIGTSTNLLVGLTGNPTTGVVLPLGNTAGAAGICVSGCGTTGTAQIATVGLASCTFDGATTANDYIQISTTTQGDCHDAGTSFPISGTTTGLQVIGRVLSTNVGAGTYQIVMFPIEMRGLPGTTLTPFSIANASSTGTFVNTLTKLTGAPSSAVVTATTDTNGAIGICVSNCSTVGTAVLQLSGNQVCVFDAGGSTANDYVTISATTAGNCHDSGATYPSSKQVIGRVLSTNVGAGTYAIDLFPAEITPSQGINQWFSITGCTPASSTDSSCTGTATIPVAYADTSYTVTHTINSINGAFLSFSLSGTKSAGSFPYTITCTFNCGTVIAPTVDFMTHHN